MSVESSPCKERSASRQPRSQSTHGFHMERKSETEQVKACGRGMDGVNLEARLVHVIVAGSLQNQAVAVGRRWKRSADNLMECTVPMGRSCGRWLRGQARQQSQCSRRISTLRKMVNQISSHLLYLRVHPSVFMFTPASATC